MSEIDNFSFNDSFSNSFSISKEQTNKLNIKDLDDDIPKEYPLRCPVCWRIPRLFANFEKNFYYTHCDNQHKNEYSTFDSFFENSNKQLDSLLCSKCKKSLEDFSQSFYCNECFLFICKECKQNHEEEIGHSVYLEINHLDIFCPYHKQPFKYYDSNKKTNLCQSCYDKNEDKKDIIETNNYVDYKESINSHIKKIKESILIWNNLSSLIREWLINLEDKFNCFIDSIKNYITLQQKIVSYLNYENQFEKYKNNFNVYFNYEIINDEKIDKYIKNINNTLNFNFSKKEDILGKSNIFIDLLFKFLNKDFNIEAKKNLNFLIKTQKKSEFFENTYTNPIKDEINNNKVEIMTNNKYQMKNSSIKCISTFNNDKTLILGLSSGKIKIFEVKEKYDNNENFLDKKLSIKLYENEINNICRLDNDLIATSDINNMIKIIQIEMDTKKYSILQELDLKKNCEEIHTIVNLPIFSYFKNKHYFSLGDNKHILIFKSNKTPKDTSPPALGYHDKPEEYSIVQPSFIFKEENKGVEEKENLPFKIEKNKELNYSANCILEIDEKYIAAASNKEKNIIIYNSQNDFKDIINYPNTFPCKSNCNMSLSYDRKKLLVGCMEGFCIISIDNLKKVNKIHLNQSILCIDYFLNDLISFIALKGEETYIKQYVLGNYKNIKKFSEKKIYSAQKIIWQKVLNKTIFYIDGTNVIHFFK